MKKFIALIMAIAMIASIQISALATDVSPIYEPSCGSCGRGRVSTTYEYGTWVIRSVTFSCKHGYPYGKDEVWTRSITAVMTCNTCDYSSRERIYPNEDREICWGRDYLTVE